jgi:multimeric flavodoxin WrbA
MFMIYDSEVRCEMGKKIVILNGSPRKKGNTSSLAASFAEGAESAGNEVTEFFLGDMKINGCRGCFGGHSAKDCPCVQKDDMVSVYPKVKEADVIVLASPLYYWTISGQLKTAIDRLFALEEGDGQKLRGNGKAGVLLMAAEGNEFEDSLNYYNHLMEHLQWKNLGTVFAGGNLAIGDIAGKPELKEAYNLGASIR